MKRKTKIFIKLFLPIFSSLIFNSCLSLIVGLTPNYTAAMNRLAPDLSDYGDYIIDKCKLPDGKIAKVYVFNNVSDQAFLQNIQIRRYSSEYKELRQKQINKLKDIYTSEADIQKWEKFYNWMPIGPESIFWKFDRALLEKYGKRRYIELCRSLRIISYYNLEDLGQLSSYMGKTSAAQATFEDSDGVYLYIIAPVKRMNDVSSIEKKTHKGQFAYEISYVPKKMYSTPVNPNIEPAKVKKINPSKIPNSDIEITPHSPQNNKKYYYDEKIAYQLQWLAVKIACRGTYDMAYTGDFSAKNPIDYYKTSFIKGYLAKNDGQASRGTVLFEGICFDYADFAYKEFQNDKKMFPEITGCYMVGTFDNPNDIVVYRIANSSEKNDMIINRTPVVVYGHSHTRAHEDAQKHSWFWVQTSDGTVYWVDPTWTDNTGRPVYGIVRGGKEVQLNPASELCVQ